MTGREEDYCKNMCHAAMETGQMNGSQKDFKKIHVMHEKDCGLKCISHVLLRGVGVTDSRKSETGSRYPLLWDIKIGQSMAVPTLHLQHLFIFSQTQPLLLLLICFNTEEKTE